MFTHRVSSYGYCASHSRFFWELRLYLVCAGVAIRVAQSILAMAAAI
jgi:hypothetical protein